MKIVRNHCHDYVRFVFIQNHEVSCVRVAYNCTVNISKKSDRAKVKPGPKLYTAKIQTGLHVGWRKGSKAGHWTLKRHIKEQEYQYRTFNFIADDTAPADGVAVVSFDQVAAIGRQWFAEQDAIRKGDVLPGFFSVTDAMRDYLADQERRKGPTDALAITRLSVAKHITNSSIGGVHLPDLKSTHIEAWLAALGDARRPRKGSDEELDRQRAQSTANRHFTTLKAGLNHAFRKGRTQMQPWKKVQPFTSADAVRENYLEIEECKRLIACCPHDDFRLMIQAALHTAGRYGEICRLKVEDYGENRLHFKGRAHSKTRGRYIALTADADAFFAAVCKGKEASKPMFIHTAPNQFKGQPWLHGHQRTAMANACLAAGIKPTVGFHILRHTVASHLAMKGTPMTVIAHMLGHTSSKITELHYAHLSNTYTSETIRANMPSYA